MTPFIEIKASGMNPVRRDMSTETLVIGRKPRAGSASVALPNAQELADEHLIVSLVRDRFHVALATGARLEPSLSGKSFKQAEIPFGSEVVLGSARIRFLGAPKKAGSPVILFALLALAGLMVWTSLNSGDEAKLESSLPTAPPLFDQDAPCPYGGPQALSRGAEAEQTAMAHGERYVFDPHDGIAAAQAYRLAASCFGSGGDASSAARARANGQRWQTKLEARYQGHQLRLRVALDRGRHDHALSEVRSLKKLLRGKNGDYITWLSMAERKLSGA